LKFTAKLTASNSITIHGGIISLPFIILSDTIIFRMLATIYSMLNRSQTRLKTMVMLIKNFITIGITTDISRKKEVPSPKLVTMLKSLKESICLGTYTIIYCLCVIVNPS